MGAQTAWPYVRGYTRASFVILINFNVARAPTKLIWDAMNVVRAVTPKCIHEQSSDLVPKATTN